MNLQQLNYIIAVDTHRHFLTAAEACHVTQPTLSMMIQKLEDELEIKIFDRSKHPVVPTEAGALIIQQARKVLHESQQIRDIAEMAKGILRGTLKLGIIPTLAPYLVPLFIQTFLNEYPDVNLHISEFTTDSIIKHLKSGLLDVGILVTPLNDISLKERPLFYESFFVYSTHTYDKTYLLPEDLNPDELWLLEEGHCLRSQILNLCELRKKSNTQLQYQAGSIETLKRLVESQHGITILPELALSALTSEQKKMLKSFKPPAPAREVSLIVHRDFLKKRLIDALERSILASLPPEILEKKAYVRVELG